MSDLITPTRRTGEDSDLPRIERPVWLYNELRHTGVDYADGAIALKYDENHLRFRNFEQETRRILEVLRIEEHHRILDMGCGTGAFVIHAAKKCRKVHAVDVSTAMLEHCQRKAADLGLTNIEFHHAGFLTYLHRDEPVDGIVSVAALHHLPDFWKGVALRRLHGMLRPGGRLYLFDIVFPSLEDGYEQSLGNWVKDIRDRAGEPMAEEAVVHIRDEYSTFDWVLEGLLKRAGFRLEEKISAPGLGVNYICQR